jgi:Alpha/beta hydrolase domain
MPARERPRASFASPSTQRSVSLQHWVECGAIAAFGAWLKNGTPPAKGDPLEIADGGSGYAKDSVGNTLGGVRTAAVDAPVSILSGQSSSSSILCALFGTTTPLSSSQVQSLYPTHDDYVNKVTAATNAAQTGGFVAAAGVPAIIQEARAAAVPQ